MTKRERRTLGVLSILFFTLFMSSHGEARIRQEKNLSYILKGHPTLKVFLGNFQNQSGASEADPKLFRKVLGEFLKTRKSAQFILVDQPSEAQIIFDVKLLSYRYLEKDPLDHVTAGTAGFIVDAFVKQNYAEIRAEYLVRDPQGRVLWKNSFKSSVTRSHMLQPEAIQRVFEEASKRLVFKCFGPPSQYRQR